MHKPLHPLTEVAVYPPSVSHNPSKIPPYLLECLDFPMLTVWAKYHTFHVQTIKDHSVRLQCSVTLPKNDLKNEPYNAWQVKGIVWIILK